MKIGNKSIGIGFNPFIIAEMSGNHNQSIEKAFEIVDAAFNAGASAIKLQTYTADTITLNSDNSNFRILDDASIWKDMTLYDLYSKAYTPWEWHKPIMNKAIKLGLEFFSSPFDETAVDFLEDLNVPAYKIASFENNHIPLIAKVASTKKPMIISTGMASFSEIEEAVEVAYESGCKDLALLKCTSTYPADSVDTNIVTIEDMRKRFKCEIGISDHTLGIGVSVAAVAKKATIIEKHLTLKRSEGGVDSEFSLEPDEFKKLIYESNQAWKSLGFTTYGPTENELESIKFRRSIFASKDIKKGEKISNHNAKVIRPSFGLKPKYFKKIIGKKVNQNIKAGTPLNKSFFDKF